MSQNARSSRSGAKARAEDGSGTILRRGAAMPVSPAAAVRCSRRAVAANAAIMWRCRAQQNSTARGTTPNRAFGFRTLGVAALLFVLLLPVVACGQEGKEITADSYWYNWAMDRVHNTSETDTYIRGQIDSHHGRQKFRVQKSQLANLELKLKGIKQAVQELINWLFIPGNQFREFTFSRLRTLTGEDFTKPDDWRSWWDANADYLVWSEKRGHLVVDEEAKQARIPAEKYRKKREEHK